MDNHLSNHNPDPAKIIPRSVARQMTGIEWTDFTGNPWIGCTRIAANAGGRSGCEICYAATFAENRLGLEWGVGAKRRTSVGFQARMRRLDKLASETGLPFAVFSLSLGDWLDPEVTASQRSSFIETVEECRHLTWLLLTHRPHLAAKLAPANWKTSAPANLWSGVTIDHPAHGYRWNKHIDYWGSTGRAWISAEPLAASLKTQTFQNVATIIMGGASGTSDASWEFNPDWVSETIDRYGENRVFFKQFGDFRDGKKLGKKIAGRDLAGRLYDKTPWPRHRDLLKVAQHHLARLAS